LIIGNYDVNVLEKLLQIFAGFEQLHFHPGAYNFRQKGRRPLAVWSKCQRPLSKNTNSQQMDASKNS
jgi:hypothetical protein